MAGLSLFTLTKVPTATRHLNLASLSVSVSKICEIDVVRKQNSWRVLLGSISTSDDNYLKQTAKYLHQLELLDTASLLQNPDAFAVGQKNWKINKKN